MAQPFGGEGDAAELGHLLAVGERVVSWQDVRGDSGQQRAAIFEWVAPLCYLDRGTCDPQPPAGRFQHARHHR
jgi:hypothetical protein